MTQPAPGEITLDDVLDDLRQVVDSALRQGATGPVTFEHVNSGAGELALHVLTYLTFLEEHGFVQYDRTLDVITVSERGKLAVEDASVWRAEAGAAFAAQLGGDEPTSSYTRLDHTEQASLGALSDEVDALLGTFDPDDSDDATNVRGDIRFSIDGDPTSAIRPPPDLTTPASPMFGGDQTTRPTLDVTDQLDDLPEPSLAPQAPAETTKPSLETLAAETKSSPVEPPPAEAEPPAAPEMEPPPATQDAPPLEPATSPLRTGPALKLNTPKPQETAPATEQPPTGTAMSQNDSFSSRRLSTQTPAAPRPTGGSGATLYERHDPIGSGGIGTVYRATQTKLGRDVAVKEIKEIFDVFAGVQRSDIVDRFQAIVQTQARLLHPNIIQIVDIDLDAQFPFVVMQLAPNGNLRRLIDVEDRPPLQTALKYFLQVLHALSTAHDNGVTHGGIKPENVVLDHAGNALMTDFGISGVADLDHGPGANQVYVGVGTVAYMSPEQFRDPNTSSVKSDIYSLGIMFYEMLTGKVPGRRSPMPSSFFPDIPRSLDDVFDRMSMDDVEERYESIDEVLEDIYASEEVMSILDKRGGFLFLRDPMSAGDGGGVGATSSPAPSGAEPVSGSEDDLEDSEVDEEPPAPSAESEAAADSEAEEEDVDDDEVLDKLDKYGELFDEESEDSDADDSDADDSDADDSDADDD